MSDMIILDDITPKPLTAADREKIKFWYTKILAKPAWGDAPQRILRGRVRMNREVP